MTQTERYQKALKKYEQEIQELQRLADQTFQGTEYIINLQQQASQEPPQDLQTFDSYSTWWSSGDSDSW